MVAPVYSRLKGTNAGNIATITVVSVAFIVSFAIYLSDIRAPGGPPFSLAVLLTAFLLGILYLSLLLTSFERLERIFGTHTRAVVFTALVVCMLAIEFLLRGSIIVWLISMPLIAMASTDLPPWPRRLVYLAAFVGVAGPYYLRYGDLLGTLLNTLTFLTAFVFVVVFVRLAEAAEKAQVEAEKLATELADANRLLGDYLVQAEELATTQERNRLAREIHDNLGHYLTVLNVQINAARALIAVEPNRADATLEKASRLTQEGLAAIRQSISALRDSPLGRRSLPEAISALAAETQAAGIVAEVHIAGVSHALDARHELTLYRAAQEGLTNVRKHARASRVDLTLDYHDPTLVSLKIHDNGVGITSKETTPGFGLLGLQERARQLGGQVATRAAIGEGYCLTISLPTISPEPESPYARID